MADVALRAARAAPETNLLAGGADQLQLEAEETWVFEGPVASIDVLHRALEGWCERTAGTVLRVRFGNTVGVFRLPGLPTLLVASGKWGDREFDRMLEDLVRVAATLPFSAGAAGPLPYDRTAIAADVLYNAFIYLRHILSPSAPEEARIAPALEAVVRHPHRRFRARDQRVALDQVRRVDAKTCIDLVSGRDLVRIVAGTGGALGNSLRDHLPQRVTERRVESELDCPENRFVLAFLRQAEAIVDAIRRAIQAEPHGRFRVRVLSDCDELERRLRPFLRRELWEGVGQMMQVPTGSTVLQGRRGYREVFRHFVRLRLAATCLPIDRQLARDLLESKDIARLYELWTYFTVVDAVRAVLGEPSRAVRVEATAFGANVRQGFVVEWATLGVRVAYNQTFTRAGRGSYSLPLRPDVTITLANGDVHILDAKFKVRWSDVDLEEEDATASVGAFSRDDLNKMHAYRDAIRNARSAWVMYPGTLFREFEEGEGVSGVGVVPVSPGEPTRELQRLIGRVLA
jgi:hypothetical protein